jgi:hypothetical protein
MAECSDAEGATARDCRSLRWFLFKTLSSENNLDQVGHEEGCEWVLLGDSLFSSGNAFMAVAETAGKESFITLHQSRERFAGVNGCRLFGWRMCIAPSAGNCETAICREGG